MRNLLVPTLLLSALGLSACVSVKPYQREDLSSPGMEASHEESEMEFRAHVHDSREGATGGHSSTGGGCGCN